MITKVFIDSDVIMDVATKRLPSAEYSKEVLAKAESGFVEAVTSSNCIANVHYLLRKQYGDDNARRFIREIIKYINVIGIDFQDVTLALDSEFKDFEDALQFYSALRHGCQAIITRNGKDYTQATIDVYSPHEFLTL